MNEKKKTTKRVLIDLPIQVHKILKNAAIDNGTFFKQEIEKLCIEKANRISTKQTELFKKIKP